MRIFLFRLSRLLPFISVGLMCFLCFHIIEGTLTTLSDFFKKNPNGSIVDVAKMFSEGVLALVLVPCVFVLIIALVNWISFGNNTLWIKEEFIETKVNKNIIFFRLSRVIYCVLIFVLMFFIWEVFGFILILTGGLLFGLSVTEILSDPNNHFYFENHLGLLSIFILLIYNWLCFGKINFWIDNPNKENTEKI